MEKLKRFSGKLLIVYLLLPTCAAILSIFLYAYVFSAFSVFTGGSHSNSAFHYPFLFIQIFVVYVVCTLPALLIRFLLLRHPIEKKFQLLLVSSLISSVCTTSCTMIVSNLTGTAGGNMTGVGLFVFLGVYMLLGMKEPKTGEALDLADMEAAIRASGEPAGTAAVIIEEEPMWYFFANGQAMGPYTRPEMMRRVHRGKIAPDTLVWSAAPQNAGKGWIAAREAGFAPPQSAGPPAGGPIL